MIPIIAKEISNTLTQNNIKHFIDFGTLLGAYREKDAIKNDYDFDIFYFPNKEFQPIKAFSHLIKKYKLNYLTTNWGQNFNLQLNEFRFELYPCVISENFYYPMHLEGFKMPLFFIDELEEIKINNIAFPCPRHLHTYLSSRYGDDFLIPQNKSPDGKEWCHVIENVNKSKKEYCGYTCGVFDMFHIGHLNLFKRIKRNFNKLIVGVHNDQDVNTYKKMPTVKYEERLSIIKSIKYVDEVLENAPLITDDNILKNLNADQVIAGREDLEYIKKYYQVSDEKLHLINRTENVSSSLIKKQLIIHHNSLSN